MRKKRVGSIAQRVISVLQDVLGLNLSKYPQNTNIYDELGATSLELAETKVELELEFDISIPFENIGEITTVAGAIRCVKDALLRAA